MSRGKRPDEAKPLKVIYFIAGLYTGGSESHLVTMLPRLDRGRVIPQLMLLHGAGDLLDVMRRTDVPLHVLDYQHHPAGLMRTIQRIRGILATERPDVVHAYNYPCDLLAAVALTPKHGCRLVTSRRSAMSDARKRLVAHLIAPRVDSVVCVSNATEAFVKRTEGRAARRSCVIPNAVEISAFRERDRRHIRILGTLGRLRRVKGTDLLLDAFTRIPHPDLRLRLAGSWRDAERGVLEERIQADPRVSYLGLTDDVPGFMSDLDLFILSSRSEGMSNSLLEAMAAGLPIVATDVGSNREVLDDGAAGVLVRPEASSIAEGIQGLLDDPDRAGKLGRRARARAAAVYDLPIMLDRYVDLYRTLAHGSG